MWLPGPWLYLLIDHTVWGSVTLVVVCVICVYAFLVLVDEIEPFLVNLYDAFDHCGMVSDLWVVQLKATAL